MTTTATEVQHKPWCTNHAAGDPDRAGDPGACSWERPFGGSFFVNVDEDEDGGGPPIVAVWGHGPIDLETARAMATAILEAADIVEEEQAGPLDVDALWHGTIADVQKVAAERGVSAAAVVRRMERPQD